MVRVSALQSVDLGFNPLVESYQKTLKNGIHLASLLGAWHLEEVVENKLASLLVVSLSKTLNGTPPPLCGRQVAQTTKWQLPSECGPPVQNIMIQFTFSWRINMANKYNMFQSKNLWYLNMNHLLIMYELSKTWKKFVLYNN